MKIVITGSRGFIGTHIRNAFDDHTIVEWDSKLEETFSGVLFQDIKNFTVSPDTDFVIHLAGLTDVRESIEIPDVYWTQNVEYSKKIFEACSGIPMLYASSSCVKEWWLSPYGTTKKVLEELALDGHIGLRFTNVYGDGAPDFMLTSRLVNGNVTHKTNHVRDFVHVSDIVSVVQFFLDQGTDDKKSVYEVGSGVGSKIDELIERHGYDVPMKEGDECEMMDNTADISDILEEGWVGPKVFI
jgi:nucleoside-diphosphate-sugar epimerase